MRAPIFFAVAVFVASVAVAGEASLDGLERDTVRTVLVAKATCASTLTQIDAEIAEVTTSKVLTAAALATVQVQLVDYKGDAKASALAADAVNDATARRDRLAMDMAQIELRLADLGKRREGVAASLASCQAKLDAYATELAAKLGFKGEVFFTTSADAVVLCEK